ncbi:uncharacterized protein DDB_G0284459-like isoform X2 [Homarus americanus]|nr:uncharacterized protein DDB_G0284459-like isoform X2 [Homarus americanus]XP_042225068.1 uncharacterized protein DDB_G0284459-like isoform X2 [Homarus americanus]
MNAFLIFCKRHRAQVREKYPHLENRQVTKILGEWWADLPAHQKTSYTELARQYKEAFLRANPDFKWYKIPAQPPRPPPARPSNQKVPRCNPLPTDGAITFGKLADEAQMGGLSTLLSTASSSSGSSSITGSSNSIGSGSSSLTTFTTAYASAGNTSAARSSPIGSLPSVAAPSTFTNANSTSISSMSTNTVAATNLSSWSGTLQRLGPGPASTNETSTNTICNGPKPNSANNTAVSTGAAVSVITPHVESATSMTPPKPPKKRYLHENLHQVQQAHTVPTPAHTPPDTDKQKKSLADVRPTSQWPQSHIRQRVESVPLPDAEALDEQQRRVTNGCVSTSSPLGIPNMAPSEPGHRFEVSHSPSQGTNGSPYRHTTPPGQPHSPPPEDQPLNLSTETTLCASQQQLIDNIVDRMCGAPNLNSVSSDNRSDVPRFFRPENLNNNNNEIEKPAFHKAIDARINGMCDVSLLVSKTIDFVIDRAYDDEKEKKQKLLSEDGKGPVSETKSNNTSVAEPNKGEQVQSDQPKAESKETVSSSSNNSSNSNTNGISSPNTRPRKRVKEDSLEENDVSHKKRRDVSGGRTSRGNSRNGVGVAGGRSRAPRACKGKIYEELISEGVLPAPRRSRTRNSRWEEAESSTTQEQEDEEDPQHHHQQQHNQEEEEENEEEHIEEEDAAHSKPPEEENGESGSRRQEDAGRKGRRQLRRLHPDDFNLEARIEALPSLSLDEFTRRKKERKRTSSASSSTHATNHSGTNTNSFPTPPTTQPTVGVVSSSSRVSAQADSTSDSPSPASATSTTTAAVAGRATAGGVSSSSSGGGSTGGNLSDGEAAASPTPSSSSSSSFSTQQHSPPQAPILVSGGSVSPGEAGLVASSDGGPLIGSQKRKARKQTITRHDPVHGSLRRDTSVVEQSVLTSMGLAALAEVALSQPIMKL